jgi:hypothetical protein
MQSRVAQTLTIVDQAGQSRRYRAFQDGGRAFPKQTQQVLPLTSGGLQLLKTLRANRGWKIVIAVTRAMGDVLHRAPCLP